MNTNLRQEMIEPALLAPNIIEQMTGDLKISASDAILNKTILNYSSDNLEEIGSHAFSYCNNLVKVDLPKVKSIGDFSFYLCKSLLQVNLPEVENIILNSFSQCTSLIDLNISKVKKIGYGAFNNCTSLDYIYLKEVTNIDNEAFKDCINLKTFILFGDNIPSLGSSVFENTPIQKGNGYIYVPKSLLNSYKTAVNWKEYQEQFKAIEDYPEITDDFIA